MADKYKNLGALLKAYRTQTGESQRDLANRLGVSNMTVSRIESENYKYRMTPILIRALRSLFSQEQLDSIEENSPEMNRLRNFIDTETAVLEMTNFTIENWKKAIAYQFSVLGLSLHENTVKSRLAQELGIPEPSDEIENSYDLEIVNGEKIWTIDLLTSSEYTEESPRTFIDYVLQRVGLCCSCICPDGTLDSGVVKERHKHSIITDIDIRSVFEKYPIAAKLLGFDFSVIHYNSSVGRMDYEYQLAFQTDGHGFFDLKADTDGKSDVSLYMNWMFSLSGQKLL